MSEEKQPQYINSVSRAIHVLELYGRQNAQSLSLAEIAKVCPGTVIAPALEVKGCKVEENAGRIAAWARENN